MKKFFVLSAIVLAVACNSSDTKDSKTIADSLVNNNPEASKNDNPMRSRDTTTNLMEDTMGRTTDSLHK